MNRERFLRLVFPKIRTKFDTHLVESGWNSITSQVLQEGSQVGVVSAKGRCHVPPEWPASATFYSGGQESLLIADNRTDAYQQAAPEARALLHRAVYVNPPVPHYEPYPGCWKRHRDLAESIRRLGEPGEGQPRGRGLVRATLS
jgi:hypothetical protein